MKEQGKYKGTHGALLHEEFKWKCNECKAGIMTEEYMAISNAIETHQNFTGHHSGRLTITKVVETWK